MDTRLFSINQSKVYFCFLKVDRLAHEGAQRILGPAFDGFPSAPIRRAVIRLASVRKGRRTGRHSGLDEDDGSADLGGCLRCWQCNQSSSRGVSKSRHWRRAFPAGVRGMSAGKRGEGITRSASNLRSSFLLRAQSFRRLTLYLFVPSIRGSCQTRIEAFLAALEIDTTNTQVHVADPTSFSLPGRPELERFFREYVLEPSADRARYAALGVQMPNGVLLYGPPGSGKSHAVAKLVAAWVGRCSK